MRETNGEGEKQTRERNWLNSLVYSLSRYFSCNCASYELGGPLESYVNKLQENHVNKLQTRLLVGFFLSLSLGS